MYNVNGVFRKIRIVNFAQFNTALMNFKVLYLLVTCLFVSVSFCEAQVENQSISYWENFFDENTQILKPLEGIYDCKVSETSALSVENYKCAIVYDGSVYIVRVLEGSEVLYNMLYLTEPGKEGVMDIGLFLGKTNDRIMGTAVLEGDIISIQFKLKAGEIMEEWRKVRQ